MSGADPFDQFDDAAEEAPKCNGICTTGWDLGLAEYGDMIANAHPDCPAHGDGRSSSGEPQPADGGER